MHWSKTRQKLYETCPRQFFYENIAGPLNPAIKSLAEKRSAGLLRHELIREAIRRVLVSSNSMQVMASNVVAAVEERVRHLIPNEFEANSEMSIIRLCLDNFFDHYFPLIQQGKVLHVSPGEPAEFVYDRVTMMVVPEVVIDEGARIRIVTWKTGASRFRSIDDLKLGAGGLTCWVRSALCDTQRPVAVNEVYLREERTSFEETLTDDDVRAFVTHCRTVVDGYGRSAKIRDFPARPGLENCRFCQFKAICPEWQRFAESSYEIDALSQEISAGVVARIQDRETHQARAQVAGEVRRVFLSHVSGDKERYVRPFARALEAHGISYWLDEAEIGWGDSIVKSINKGLAISDYVVCFISESFIERGWPEAELGAATAAQLSSGAQTVLPLLLTDPATVMREYPLLRDRAYREWSAGIDNLIRDLEAALRKS